MGKIEQGELTQRQNLSLDRKIDMSISRIINWYEENNGNVYVSFSGGKDSTVLLHMVRQVYKNVLAVFIDTGLEYPEIREFVKTVENVKWIRPEKSFNKIIEEHGFPVISKMQAQYIDQYRNSTEKMKKLRWEGKVYNGVRNYKISEKWKFLVDAPFKISDKCCEYLKKRPIRKFNKESGLSPYVATMASDSIQRKKQYLQEGCNSFNLNISRPMGFWLERDIWEYINRYNLTYAAIYDKGVKRTGCMFCMFGVHLETEPNRFQIMKKEPPKQYAYCINQLGCGKVLDFIGVKY